MCSQVLPQSVCGEWTPRDPWERALGASSDGLWEWRPNGETWCAPQFWRLLGYSVADTAAGRDFTRLLHPSDRLPVAEQLHECCEAGRPFDMQFRLQAQSGEFLWVRAQAAAYRDDERRPYSVAGSIKDITGYRATAEALRDREKRFYRRQRLDALDCLAGGIAHEFNNLMQAVRGYIECASRSLPPESDAAQDLAKALLAVGHSTELTGRLLNFAGSEEQDEHLVDVGAVVAAVTELVRPIIGSGIVLTCRTCEEPLTVLADETALRQALLNLCINARDAMDGVGELTIEIHPFWLAAEHGATIGELKPGGYARILVTDTGVGVPSHLIEKIFQPFFSTKEVGKGSGLGLPSVLGAVEAFGGHVELHTAPNVGTTFAIYLPLIKGTEVDRSPETRPNRRVLLAAPESPFRESTRRMLESIGCRVTCSDGIAAAREVLGVRPITFDLLLADVDARTAALRDELAGLRAVAPSLPCVVTAGVRHAVRQDLADMDDINVLQKPLDAAALAAGLAAAMRYDPMATE